MGSLSEFLRNFMGCGLHCDGLVRGVELELFFG